MSLHLDTQSTVGTFIGAICGFAKGILLAVSGVEIVKPVNKLTQIYDAIIHIPIHAVVETSVLALVGAITGLVTTAITKWIFKKIRKLFN